MHVHRVAACAGGCELASGSGTVAEWRHWAGTTPAAAGPSLLLHTSPLLCIPCQYQLLPACQRRAVRRESGPDRGALGTLLRDHSRQDRRVAGSCVAQAAHSRHSTISATHPGSAKTACTTPPPPPSPPLPPSTPRHLKPWLSPPTPQYSCRPSPPSVSDALRGASLQCTSSSAAGIWAWPQQRGNLTVTSVSPVLCSAPHACCQVPRLRGGTACPQGEPGGQRGGRGGFDGNAAAAACRRRLPPAACWPPTPLAVSMYQAANANQALSPEPVLTRYSNFHAPLPPPSDRRLRLPACPPAQ